MAYTDHFRHADDLIAHLASVVPGIPDPLLKLKYIGLVSIAAITVYELAVKEIFIDFAQRKHKVLGCFAESHFDRINGKVRLEHIQKDYIPKFGDKYLARFKKKIDRRAKEVLRTHRRDIRSAYSNIITWRNDFAHEGKLNGTATFQEVVQAYEDGKEVLHSLADSMRN